eukprot:SAG31_NODE_176_length_21334_cov_12.211067_11_plen_81_part_00
MQWEKLSRAKFGEVRSFRVITKGQDGAKRLAFTLEDGSEVGLANGNQFVGCASCSNSIRPRCCIITHTMTAFLWRVILLR